MCLLSCQSRSQEVKFSLSYRAQSYPRFRVKNARRGLKPNLLSAIFEETLNAYNSEQVLCISLKFSLFVSYVKTH